ncbi:predicted protein [Phaeodactylum tricornutum CCAP 1055/1]|uniref:Uncharacterized protein n=2 Tax=Phaeodactylum tricornutum TaxID=2850 RepID=B7FWZ0_PHATC|nr:predicted protein [Phaeodactylum tricornutum CCAP 1055/1]EEC49288.1 predicted protein [Phaeodactylum tricornutum CCAP 1055/1]|eukprot:XP_002179465.1 predicted protein [Phaeodactylum tricornutum CCAP 1055/1]
MKFIITYRRIWIQAGRDGVFAFAKIAEANIARARMASTAENCVKEIFPGSQIVANRTDRYPIRVIVSVEADGKSVEIWSGSQRDLFQKYRANREKSVQAIKNNLTKFKATSMDA